MLTEQERGRTFSHYISLLFKCCTIKIHSCGIYVLKNNIKRIPRICLLHCTKIAAWIFIVWITNN